MQVTAREFLKALGLGGFVEIDREENASPDDYFKSVMKTVNDKDL